MGIGRRRDYDWERQTAWNEEARLHGTVVRFSAAAPPADWERQHDTLSVNPYDHPVPRQASCHYYRLDTDARNVYFY